jgi:hypothetical protein
MSNPKSVCVSKPKSASFWSSMLVNDSEDCNFLFNLEHCDKEDGKNNVLLLTQSLPLEVFTTFIDANYVVFQLHSLLGALVIFVLYFILYY